MYVHICMYVFLKGCTVCILYYTLDTYVYCMYVDGYSVCVLYEC